MAKQVHQAERMMKIRRTTAYEKTEVGKLISVKMDYHDVSHPRAIHGVIFHHSYNGAGGSRIAMEKGIICKSGENKSYYIPVDRYKVLDEDDVISSGLAQIQDSILKRTFDATSMKHMTMQQIHNLMYGLGSDSIQICRCKNGCKHQCGCFRKKKGWASKCKCNGKCYNAFNGNNKNAVKCSNAFYDEDTNAIAV